MFARPLVLGALGTVGLTRHRQACRSRARRRAADRTRARTELARWEGEGGALPSAGRSRAVPGARG